MANPSFLTKLNSDRLWAVLAFAGLVVVNTYFELGIDLEQIKQIGYAVIALVLGKSIRGTGIEAAAGAGIAALTTAVDGAVSPLPSEGGEGS